MPAMLGRAYAYLKPQSLLFCRSALQARSILAIQCGSGFRRHPVESQDPNWFHNGDSGPEPGTLKNTGKSCSSHGKDIHFKSLLVSNVLEMVIGLGALAGRLMLRIIRSSFGICRYTLAVLSV
jgi:hypothetical protein